MRKAITVILCLLLLTIMAAGCEELELRSSYSSQNEHFLSEETQPSQEQEEEPLSQLRLAYSPSDGFNPFRCATKTNLSLASLQYEALLTLRPDYTTQPALALSASLSGLTCTIQLDPEARFSDGSPVTAKDAAASFSAAMASENYSASLSNIDSVSVSGDLTVTVQLKTADRFFCNLLLFPIVKSGTENQSVPVGSGRYVLQGTAEHYRLAANPYWYNQKTATFPEISLISISDSRSQIYSLRLGELDFVSADPLPQDVVNVGAATSYDTNSLVYLGCNNSRRSLSFRQAFYQAIDRTLFVEKGYSGKGTPATTPFSPVASVFSGLNESYGQYDVQPLLDLLSSQGYGQKDEEGYLTNGNSRFTLTLLVNSDNSVRMLAAEELVRQMKELGIQMILDQRSFSQYSSALQSGDFDLYLAEVQFCTNFDISALLNPEYGAAFGFSANEQLLSAYASYRAGTGEAAAVCELFYQQMPFFPLSYRASYVVYARELKNRVTATQQDLFYNLDQWQSNEEPAESDESIESTESSQTSESSSSESSLSQESSISSSNTAPSSQESSSVPSKESSLSSEESSRGSLLRGSE